MKTLLLSATAIMTCSFATAQAQVNQDSILRARLIAQAQEQHNRVIRNARFVFEGEVIYMTDSVEKDVFGSNATSLYTSNIIKITNILRGSNKLKLGTIEIITKGHNKEPIKNAAGEIVSYFDNNMNQHYVVGVKAMFFCVAAKNAPTLNTELDNSMRLHPYALHTREEIFVYGGGYGVRGMRRAFARKRQFYDFLRDFENLNVPELPEKKSNKEEPKETIQDKKKDASGSLEETSQRN